MKSIRNKLVGAAVVCAVTPAVYASGVWVDQPYVGIEVIQTNQNYKNGASNIYKKNTQDYSVFAGSKFWRWLGAEVGYEFQPNRNKDAHIVAGQQTINGTTLTTGEFLNYQSAIQTRHPYLGLFAEYDACMSGFGKVKLQGLVGASVSHVKARDALLSDEFGVLSQADYNASIHTYSKTKVVPMVKLIATFMVSNHVGVRVSANYRNMGSFTAHAEQAGSTAQLKFKDTYGIGLGLTYNFCK